MGTGRGGIGRARSRADGRVGGRDRVIVIAAGVANNSVGRDDWLDDCAGAIGDGQGGGRSHDVGLAAVGDLGGLRAVGGDGRDDLGDVRYATGARGGDRARGGDGTVANGIAGVRGRDAGGGGGRRQQ